MNILKFELRMKKSSMITWSAGISAFIFIYMVFFPTMMQDNVAFEEMMANFPEEFLAFFGMSSEISFTSLLGYYALTMSFVLIPLAIQASVYGFSILSVEESELTADFLLTKPVSRSTIFINKFISALVALILSNLGVWIASIASLYLFNAGTEFVLDNVLVVLSSLIFFQLFFLTVGMAISVSVKKVSSVIAYSMALGFGLFIVSSFGEMLSNNLLKIISVYSHFNTVEMIVEGHYNWPLVSVTIAISIIAFFVGYFLYQRRNIASL